MTLDKKKQKIMLIQVDTSDGAYSCVSCMVYMHFAMVVHLPQLTANQDCKCYSCGIIYNLWYQFLGLRTIMIDNNA